MRVLVTGGAGYIGSVVNEALLESGHEVVVLDNLSKGHRDAVAPEATFIHGDVGDAALVRRLLREQRIAGVIHMAAFIEVAESVAEPARYFDNNFLRPVTLLEELVRAGGAYFVLSSTAAVYAPQADLLQETSPVAPASPYGLSKLYVEQALAWYATRGIRHCALRYFNAAGATLRHGERHQPESHLIPLVLAAAAGERGAIQVYGTDYETPDGTCVRDYIHVRDLAEAHVLALRALEREAAAPAAERAYNLGNGVGYSVREVIAAASRVCGRPIPVVEGPRRAGDVARLVASAARMRALGWRPRMAELEAIVASAWEWKQRQGTAGAR